MGKFGTGQAMRRVEDRRFLTGAGGYLDDLPLERPAFLHFYRSPYAHGDIRELDLDAARETPGVLAIYTVEDLERAGIGDVPGEGMMASSRSEARAAILQPPLARGRVRYVGEPVAAIVAESVSAARDAADSILFDVDELPVVARLADALEDGAPQVHDDVPGNLYGILEHGDREATRQALAGAARRVSIELVNNRLAPTAMEPRGCVAAFDGEQGYTLWQGCQGVHSLQQRTAKALGVEPDRLRVVSPDVGGGFGLKIFLQCETLSVLHAARELGRPVKWVAERTESFLADLHGRDQRTRATLALDEENRFTALEIETDANVGPYMGQASTMIPWFGYFMATGAYTIPAAYVGIRHAATNCVPTDAYRGAGRPEAAYLIERLVDKAARELGVAPAELRRRNFIPPDAFPYRTPTGQSYDSGEYEAVMDAALERADWTDFEQRREAAAARGRLRGIGMSYYVEICSAFGAEQTHIKFERDGTVTALVGTQSTGQGHETSYAQMVAAELGVPVERVRVRQGDTAVIPTGEGTGGSRTMAIGGSSLVTTAAAVIEQGREIAASLLEADAADVEFEPGRYRIAGTDREIGIDEVAAASYDEAGRPAEAAEGLESSERFEPEAGTFPNGCHVCEVEIDPETGELEIVAYTVEDDVGTVVNPLILEGQIVGGIAQGLGQAMMEEARYDPESGQLETATFLDYAMPRAERMPGIRFRYREVPSPRNPLGVKGAGEAGTIGAPPALVNAVVDALAPLGVMHIDMPVTPLKLWETIRAARDAA